MRANVQIRPAGSADVPVIRAIVADAYGHYVERLGRLPAPMTENYPRLVREGGVWAIKLGGKVAGLIVLRHASDHLLISNIAVGRSFQGYGLGRMLLDHAEAQARRLELNELRLYTHQLMHENLAIYRKLDWEEYDRAEHEGFPRVFMRKRLMPDGTSA